MEYEIAESKEEVAGLEAQETEGNVKKQARKPKSHHYHETYDGDQALINPVPSRHVETATETRRVTALAHAFRTQGLGGS